MECEQFISSYWFAGRDLKNGKSACIQFGILLDVSGSMESQNKLPLLKKAFKLLVKELREDDRVAIVVYAGSSGLVFPSTSGKSNRRYLDALDRLQAGGSTAGGAGLKLAYQVAVDNFIDGGNNRIILATDGDFNVGPSSNAEMERLIEEERKKESSFLFWVSEWAIIKMIKWKLLPIKEMEIIHTSTIFWKPKKVLVNEFGGTLFTIAKDVKIQIEFNPAVVE